MTIIKFGAALLALMLIPALAFAAVLHGTVVKLDRVKQVVIIQTEEGQKTLQLTSNTKGLENAREGAKVAINYDQKGKQLVASEISGGEAGPKAAPGSMPAPEKGGAKEAPRAR